MDILIPDTVLLSTGIGAKYKSYCFAHAILRALEGEKICMELSDYDRMCDDCILLGELQTHELSSLRRTER